MPNKPLILVVDDEPLNLKILSVWLERQGINVVTASDGDDAIKSFLEHSPDLTFMDINMPKKDGRIATEVIKTSHPEAVVIALTTDPKEMHIQKDGSFSPFDGFYEKPYNFEEIRSVLEKTGINLHSEV